MGKNKKSTVNQNTNDLTVYKVGAAFALLVLSLLALGRILNVYATGSTFDVVYRASQTVWTLCVILCAASVAAFIVLRKKSIRKVFPYVFVLSLLAGVTALDLRYFWTEHATALYMLHAAVYCLYIIFCLYRSEFEYLVDAYTGKVISGQKDLLTTASTPSTPNVTTKPSDQKPDPSGTAQDIGYAKAKSIALNHAGVSENEAYDMDIELDDEDGILVYEVEFKSGNMEYDYEINAATGAILKHESELDD